jgi:DNA-binding LytR/AlgR family response regulator
MRGMTNAVGTARDAADLRVIVCVAFKRSAPPDQVSALKKAVIACPSTLHAIEVTGTFDFMMELAVPDIATFNERLNVVAPSVASLVERYEVNFVSNRLIRKNGGEQAIWVPCVDGMQRLDCAAIDKVAAEGDYMRVHSDGHSWLVHSTMRSLVQRIASDDVIQLHRSMAVRAGFIDRLVHDGGRWFARLHDGTRERVAKSHVVETLKHFRPH